MVVSAFSVRHGLATALGFDTWQIASAALGIYYGNQLVNQGLARGGDIYISLACTTFLVPIQLVQLGLFNHKVGVARAAAKRLFDVIERESRIDPLSLAGTTPATFNGVISMVRLH